MTGFLNFSSQSVGEWTIYPWIHSNCNTVSDEDQLRPVSIPDILPARYCLNLLLEIPRDSLKFSIQQLVVLGTISKFINVCI